MNLLDLVILLPVIGAPGVSGNKVKAMKSPLCLEEEWLDTSEKPPICRPCTRCLEEEKELSRCTDTKDRVCSYCKRGYVWSELESFCTPCGCCNGKHQVQPVCLAAGLSVNEACIADGPCPKAQPSTNNKVDIFIVVLAPVGSIVVVICVLLVVAGLLWRRKKTKKVSQRRYSPAQEDGDIAYSQEETTPESSGDSPASLLTSPVGCLWNNLP